MPTYSNYPNLSSPITRRVLSSQHKRSGLLTHQVTGPRGNGISTLKPCCTALRAESNDLIEYAYIAPGGRNKDGDFTNKSELSLPLRKGNGFSVIKPGIAVLGAGYSILLVVYALPLRGLHRPYPCTRFRSPGATETI
jgi:hypothetical protein